MLLMLRKIVPSVCTLANLIFGLISIVLMFDGHYDWAAVFIVVGALFDGFDGRLARFLNVSSEFGKQLDSLSDLVTFGVAPAMLAYVSSLHVFGMPWGLIAMVPFPIMGALRLARFNVLDGGDGFIGVPITLAGGLLALSLMYSGYIGHWVVLIIVLVLSWLMVSTFQYPDFKTMGMSRPLVLFIMAVLIGAVIVLRWHAPVFFMFPIIIYLLVGIKNRWVDLWQSYKKNRA